jgi:hypothetical protein
MKKLYKYEVGTKSMSGIVEWSGYLLAKNYEKATKKLIEKYGKHIEINALFIDENFDKDGFTLPSVWVAKNGKLAYEDTMGEEDI